MKEKLLPDGFGISAAATIAVLFIVLACHSPKNQTPTETTPASGPSAAATGEKMAANFFDTSYCPEIIALANDYVDSVFKQLKESTKSSDDLLEIKQRAIKPGFGNAYMRSYRRNVQMPSSEDNTKTVFISKRDLSFYLLYVLQNGEKGVQVSFGRYDSIELRVDGLRDPVLQDQRRDRQNRNTIVVGLPAKPRPTTIRYTTPFSLGTRSDTTEFYDDWHEIWP